MNPHGTKDAEAALAAAYDEGVRYLREFDDAPVPATTSQQEALDRLGRDLPEDGAPAADVIRGFIAAAEGGVTATAGGRWLAFVVGGAHPAGIAADWLSSAWDEAPGTPLGAPFACAVDGLVCDWTKELLDLPREASVGIVTGTTVGNFVGVAAARNGLLARHGWDVEAMGLYGAPDVRVVITEEAHPTMLAGLRMAGFGSERVVKVATDRNGAMKADAFAETLASIPPGAPTLVCAQAGHIHTGAFDPLAEIAPLCRARGAWLHVDGAFGLWARANPATRYLTEGMELADSWATDAHKWLNTPYDGAFAIVRDAAAHERAMSVSASYLPQAEGGRDPSRFVPELSRRARAHPIYAVIRHLGRAGIADAVERCCANARLMRDLLTQHPSVRSLADVVINQAAFQFRPRDDSGAEDDAAADALTKDVVRRAVATGEVFLQTAEWRGRTIMRCSVTSHATTEDDIRRVAAIVLDAFRRATN